MVHVIYAHEEAPDNYSKSIFLVGPTPRDENTPSWRPDMIAALEEAGYDGVIFSPEPRGEFNSTYDGQVAWEKKHLEMADLILAWVPRQSPSMPAFTTNVEFGKYVGSNKLLYGRPSWAEKVRYLDWMYMDHGLGQPYVDMKSIAKAAVERLGAGAQRKGGDRHVPLHIWHSQAFQNWYANHFWHTNRIADAKVLWDYYLPNGNLFSFALWVKIWISDEKRFKTNEFVFSRSDICTVLAFQKGKTLMDTKVLLIEEYRVPVRNHRGKVVELPGGSCKEDDFDPYELAFDEFKEETGINIDATRLMIRDNRQLYATLSSSHANLFSIELTEEEMAQAKSSVETFGVKEDTERTKILVFTVEELLKDRSIDWATMGMILTALQQ